MRHNWPVLSFQCGAGPVMERGRSDARLRISGVLWSPDDQDRLVVYFMNRLELRIYDVESGATPPPFVRLGDDEAHRDDPQSRAEGTTGGLFMPVTAPSSTGRCAADVDNWPESINISTGYVLPKSGAQKQPTTLQAYFTTPPSTSSFLPSTDDSVETIWSSEVTAQYSDDHGEDAIL